MKRKRRSKAAGGNAVRDFLLVLCCCEVLLILAFCDSGSHPGQGRRPRFTFFIQVSSMPRFPSGV